MKIKFSELGDPEQYKRIADDRFVYYWSSYLKDWYTTFGFNFGYYHKEDIEVEAIIRYFSYKTSYYLSKVIEPYRGAKNITICREEQDLIIMIDDRKMVLPIIDDRYDLLEEGVKYSLEELDI